MTAITYRAADVNGLKVFYREAGASTAPKLLLHGFPTAGHMFRDLIPLLFESRNGEKASSFDLKQAGCAKSLSIDRADAISKYQDVSNSGLDSDPLGAVGCTLGYCFVLATLFCHGKI
jgi:hypothetical protein